jgi:hypothetical protein
MDEKEKIEESSKKHDFYIGAYGIARSNPKMIEISLHEIKSFFIIESVTKYITIGGSLLVGGIISAYFSAITVNPLIIGFSVAIFVGGLYLDHSLIFKKFRELELKGEGTWQ